MSAVSKTEFKARALEFFRQIETTGGSLIITDHGHPALEVRPYVADNQSPLEKLRGSVLRYDAPFESASDDWEQA